MLENLDKYNIILGSGSSRRKELLSHLDLSFTIISINQEEIYPKKLPKENVPIFLAEQKALYLSEELQENDLLITADTIVLLNQIILNKPKNNVEAFNMLSQLSNNSHKVITGVCIKTLDKKIVFSTETRVTFKKLSNKEINYYIKNFHPLDKSGGYGIQDWIGKIGIINIQGSYSNVVGLPLHDVYDNLKRV